MVVFKGLLYGIGLLLVKNEREREMSDLTKVKEFDGICSLHDSNFCAFGRVFGCLGQLPFMVKSGKTWQDTVLVLLPLSITCMGELMTLDDTSRFVLSLSDGINSKKLHGTVGQMPPGIQAG